MTGQIQLHSYDLWKVRRAGAKIESHQHIVDPLQSELLPVYITCRDTAVGNGLFKMSCYAAKARGKL